MCHILLSLISSKQLQRHWTQLSATAARKTSNNNIIQTSFHKSYEILINDSHLLTQTYQNEIKKWQLKQYNNSTIISITDNYLPKFQKLIKSWSFATYHCIGCWNLVILYEVASDLTNLNDMFPRSELDSQWKANVLLDRLSFDRCARP